MTKTIKFFSLILALVIVLSLSLMLVACNKNDDENKVEYVEDSLIDGLLQEFIDNTKAADSFRYESGRDEISYDLVAMKVLYNNQETMMLKGKWVDYVQEVGKNGDILETKDILFGDYYTLNNNQKEFTHKTLATYEYKNNSWTESNLGYTSFADFEIYSATKEIEEYLDRANNGYGTAICVVAKTTNKGKLLQYDVKITFSEKNVCQFSTIEYQGKQVISEMVCATSVDRSYTFRYTMKYTYGVTFEIPVANAN